MYYDYLIGFMIGFIVVQFPIYMFIQYDKRAMKKYFNNKYPDFKT